jgi:hypothetical protein
MVVPYLAHGRVGMASKELADLLAQKLGGAPRPRHFASSAACAVISCAAALN